MIVNKQAKKKLTIVILSLIIVFLIGVCVYIYKNNSINEDQSNPAAESPEQQENLENSPIYEEDDSSFESGEIDLSHLLGQEQTENENGNQTESIKEEKVEGIDENSPDYGKERGEGSDIVIIG